MIWAPATGALFESMTLPVMEPGLPMLVTMLFDSTSFWIVVVRPLTIWVAVDEVVVISPLVCSTVCCTAATSALLTAAIALLAAETAPVMRVTVAWV